MPARGVAMVQLGVAAPRIEKVLKRWAGWLHLRQRVAPLLVALLLAINMLALGLTPSLCKILYDVTGSTPAIPIAERFQSASQTRG